MIDTVKERKFMKRTRNQQQKFKLFGIKCSKSTNNSDIERKTHNR